MKADEIMHVLRLVALGRINTPEQVAFCEKLEQAFAKDQPVEAVDSGAPIKIEVLPAEESDVATARARVKRAKKESAE